MGEDRESFDGTPAIDEGLLDLLTGAGLISPDTVDLVRAIHGETGLTLTDVVLGERLVTEKGFLSFFARRESTRFVTTSKLAEASIDRAASERLPVRAAELHGCLPLWWEPATKTFTAVVAVPLTPERVEDIRRVTGANKVVVYVATWTAVRAGIQRVYYGNPTAFDELNELGAAPPPRRPISRQERKEKTRIQYRSDKEMMIGLRQENARFRIAQSFHRRVPLERTVERQMEAILDLVLDLIPADNAVIRLVSGQEAKRSPPDVSDKPLPDALVSRAMDSDEGVVLTDPELATIRTGSVIQRGVRSALVMPLRSRERTIGIMYLESLSAPAAFDGDDRALLAALASQAAAAIHNAELIGVVEKETAARSHLARFLPPELVDSAVAGDLDKHLETRSAVVTVLFVDIRDFTRLSARADAQEVVSFLGCFYDEMSQAVFAEGGMVDKFMGDGVMAVWGAPVPRSDHAVRALKAALAMKDKAMRCLLSGQHVGIGVGVATGEVILGTVGSGQRLEYTAVGGPVNLAARLSDMASAGEIIASEASVREAKDLFSVETKGPVSVKGLDAPAPVYRVAGARGEEPETKAAVGDDQG